MKKFLPLALVLLLASACGGGGTTNGGGGNGNGNNGNNPPPGQTAAERTQEILEDCQIEEAIAFARDIVGFLRDLTDGTATAAGFTLNGAPNITDSPGTGMVMIPWTLDIDNDMSEDANGTIQFFDMGNQPTNPALPLSRWNPFAGGDLDTIAPILAGPPPPAEGTQLFTDFNGSNIVLATGQVAAQYSGGAATTTAGDVGTSGGGCTVALSWVAQLIANFLTTFPTNITITGTITLGGDMITGDITTNGTNIATTMMTINGGETNTFQINLTTGTITHVP